MLGKYQQPVQARLLSLGSARKMMNSTSITLEMTTASVFSNLSTATVAQVLKNNDSDGDINPSGFPYDYTSYNYDDLSIHAPCVYEKHGKNVLPVFYSLFFLVGFLGNVLVLWVIMAGAHLKSMTDVCLLNLALADLLLVLSLPFLAYYASHSWIFGQIMCTMVLGMYYIGFYSGIFFIVLMSIDRYLAVVHAVFALRVRTKTYGILASLTIWIIAVSASFPELVHLKVEENNEEFLCSAYPTNPQQSLNQNQTHFLRTAGLFKINILGLLIPLCIVGFCYSMVLKRLLTIRSSKKFAIRLVILVMVVFFCCWTPYNIAALIKGLELMTVIPPKCETSKMIQSALQFTEAIAYSHSCLNPILYVFVGEKFKRHLFRLLRQTPCIKMKFMKSYLTQTAASVYSQTTSVDERSTAM
ncbi:C-C chemokine receptor type 5-like isoform X1 [Salminus brasiliensis]|uniref:C-C chemokine receptor type 5-like isoform X1 n=2 Tax=Salminus brasiliensis TaxID=930266 RepID=UPI003B83546E